MYKVFCDGVCIFDPSSEDISLQLEEGTLSLGDNIAGSFEFTISPGGKGYNLVEKMVSEISVYRDSEELWAGRVTTEREDFWRRKKFHAEGELSYLNDTIQPQIDYTGSPYNFLNMILNTHNGKVASNRTIYMGNITMTQEISFNDGYKTTWSMIEDKLINAIGGHIRIRKVGSTRYLDYFDSWGPTNSQNIEFGKNLLDYAKNFDMTEFATAVMAKGASKEDGSYVTIASVNNGNAYYEKSSLISIYGRIEKIKEWGEIDDPTLLYHTVENYMNNTLYDDLSLELSVLDLHDLDTDIEGLHILDQIRCISSPHGMNRLLPLTEMSINIIDPSKTTISLNTEKKKELTRTLRKTQKEVSDIKIDMPDEGSILEKAQKAAAALINACTNGYITIVHNEDHASELIISEKQNWPNGKYWRWNYNGLGFFVNGNQVSVAMTMDGQIVANAITTGEMSANRIKGGTLELGNYDNLSGKIVIYDETGKIIGKWDCEGIDATKGTIHGTLKNGDFSGNGFGWQMESGHLKGFYHGSNTSYISCAQQIDGVGGAMRIGAQEGLILLGPKIMVSKSYIGPGEGASAEVGGDGAFPVVTNFSTSGEGLETELSFSYKNVKFTNGIMTGNLEGGSNIIGLPQPVLPPSDTAIQEEIEAQFPDMLTDLNEENMSNLMDYVFSKLWTFKANENHIGYDTNTIVKGSLLYSIYNDSLRPIETIYNLSINPSIIIGDKSLDCNRYISSSVNFNRWYGRTKLSDCGLTRNFMWPLYNNNASAYVTHFGMVLYFFVLGYSGGSWYVSDIINGNDWVEYDYELLDGSEPSSTLKVSWEAGSRDSHAIPGVGGTDYKAMNGRTVTGITDYWMAEYEYSEKFLNLFNIARNVYSGYDLSDLFLIKALFGRASRPRAITSLHPAELRRTDIFSNAPFGVQIFNIGSTPYITFGTAWKSGDDCYFYDNILSTDLNTNAKSQILRAKPKVLPITNISGNLKIPRIYATYQANSPEFAHDGLERLKTMRSLFLSSSQ